MQNLQKNMVQNFYLRPKNISTSTSNDFETFNFNEK